MNFPSFCYSTDNFGKDSSNLKKKNILNVLFFFVTASHLTPSVPSDQDASSMINSSMADRIRFFMSYIDEAAEVDLYNFFIEIIHEIFGRGPTKGWTLDEIKPRV